MTESKIDKSALIWSAALRDAAGTLSAYHTPSEYTLENLSLYSSFDSDGFFVDEISRRIDLGRVNVFASLLPQVENSLTKAYRHQIYYSNKVLSGKISIPRLIMMRARGDQRIPVVRAEKQLITPENLLISELLNTSIQLIKPWIQSSGAEKQFALNLLKNIQFVESSYPWAELRHLPRPILRELTQSVIARTKIGITEPNGPFQQIAEIFSDRFTKATAFEKSNVKEAFTQPTFLLITQQPEFEDRVFELLCLGWIINALNKCVDTIEINPSAIKGKKKPALLTAFYKDLKIELFFQSAFEVLGKGIWIDAASKQYLRGIPDIILRLTKSDTSKLVIIDAKNRSKASESEVAYKLIGYKDNFGLNPFVGIGLFPSFENHFTNRHLINESNHIYLLHLPLLKAKKFIQRICLQQINNY